MTSTAPIARTLLTTGLLVLLTATAVAAQTDAPRPAPLVPLYVSFAALEVGDTWTTFRALDRHTAREGNGAMARVVTSRPATIALKAGAAGLLLVGVERLRQHHPRAAIVAMVALNGLYAGVVVHNYRIGARRTR